MNKLNRIETGFPRGLDPSCPLNSLKEGGRWIVIDTHGSVALNVGVTADWTGAGTRLGEVAADEQQVGDLLDGSDRILMLGDTHGPADNHALGVRHRLSEFPDLCFRNAGLCDDVIP